MRHAILYLLAVLMTVGAASAQTVEVVGSTLAVGASPTSPDGTTVRLDGLGTSGGTLVLFSDTDGDVFERALAVGDIPSVFGRTDTMNTWSLLQTFTSGLTSNGLLTIGGVNDLLLGTGGMRVASGGILLRNIADSATIASFADAAITLSQPTAITGNSSVTGTFDVSALSTLTGGYSAGASSSIAGNLTLTGTGAITAAGDVAVNGGDLTSTGALTVRPTGNLTLDPTGDIVMAADGADVLPDAGYRVNVGALSNKFLALHAAELWVETLVAQDTIATIGGRVLVGPTTMLAADLASGATSITVKHNQMASGDRVYMEANGKVEFLAITSAAGGSAGAYTYSVTRNLDGTGANDWNAGDALFNTGTTGNGFIDLYSVRGVKAGSEAGPTIVGNVRNSSTYNDWSPRWAVGNLNGLYGYGATTYGFAAGSYTAQALTADATNGIRMLDNGVRKVQLDATSLRFYDSSGTTYPVEIGANYAVFGYQTAGWGNTLIGSAGDLYIRSGTTTRMLLAASNGAFSLYDDDGTTVRAQIGASEAYFGSTGGARFQVNYGSSVRGYDSANKLYYQLDATNGVLIGDWYTGAGKGYAQMSDRYFRLCLSGGAVGSSCTLEFDGNSGNITSTGSITLSTGGDVLSTGNFSLSNANGLRFETTTAFSNPKSVQWGNPSSGAYSQIMGYTSGTLNFRSNNGTASADMGLYRSSTYHTLVVGVTAVTNQDVQILPPDSTGDSRLGNSSIQWDAVYATTYYAGTTAGYTGTLNVAGSCSLVISGGIITNYSGICP